jgi:hypothetical protein
MGASAGNRRAGFVDFLLAHQNPAGQDHGARPFAAGNKPPLHQQKVHAHFCPTEMISFNSLSHDVNGMKRAVRAYANQMLKTAKEVFHSQGMTSLAAILPLDC